MYSFRVAATEAGGAHSTRMHSCCIYFMGRRSEIKFVAMTQDRDGNTLGESNTAYLHTM